MSFRGSFNLNLSIHAENVRLKLPLQVFFVLENNGCFTFTKGEEHFGLENMNINIFSQVLTERGS